jgi:hypothetical protein
VLRRPPPGGLLFADHAFLPTKPCAFRFNRQPKPTTVAPILLIEDFVDARASGLFDSPFGRTACSFA